ncbi:MAG: hypothetical protein L0332_27210 [Chloroflexi bacterium]|nr:hypothetical protein [Chloroflexota bacterium]MCI0577150.1 hypothetical protein [Chloroflexota bacterium]MCI0644690.1 hypothetical protein [Chloroflexota bacterium]MCI0730388.1 hypothetical protein [Chloroflexota bacterium]
MDFVIHNLRLQELVAIVQENKRFYEDFVSFLQEQGYRTVLDFIQDPSDERAAQTISSYLNRPADVILYDGLLRPYDNSKAKWFFLAWLLRDAATQRLQPLLRGVPGRTIVQRKTYLLNEIRKFVAPLFPQPESWEWPAVSEVMLARLEGSRRSLKGTLFEDLVRRSLEKLITKYGLFLTVSTKEARIHDETYDVQIVGGGGVILLPVKTRETMGGGHALLFTRDIYKSILVATEHGYTCIPIIIAESWSGDLDTLKSELYIHIQANPNQVAAIEPVLAEKLEGLLPLFRQIAVG